MLTERDLLETIEECRAVKKPTATTVQLMASCYTIIDHLRHTESRSAGNPPAMYSYAAESNLSDFTQAAKKAGLEKTLNVLDEHMDCVKSIYPKEYAAILRRLRD